MSIQRAFFVFCVQNQLEEVSALLGAQVVETFSTAGIGAYIIARKQYLFLLRSFAS